MIGSPSPTSVFGTTSQSLKVEACAASLRVQDADEVSDAGRVVERCALLEVVEETRSPAEEQLVQTVLNRDTVLSCPDVSCTVKAPAMRGSF